METPKNTQPADQPSARTGKATRLQESSVFAPRPRRETEKESARRPAWRKWIPRLALTIALGLIVIFGAASFATGLPDSIQLAGFAGGADTDTPTATAANIPTSTAVPTATQTLPPTATFTPTLDVGDSWIRPADGMAMMYVPAGPFTMGASADQVMADCAILRGECEREWFADQEPPHLVELDAFWMDQTEVTNAMYALCVNAGACKPPRITSSDLSDSYYDNPEFADYPVIYMNWNQANDYCEWAGARLPTEAEWEKAARGTDARFFPWGDSTPTCSLMNFHPVNGSACKGDPNAARDYPDGQSPYQIFNLAGNVFEWVSDWYDANYYSVSPAGNPQGPPGGLAKIMRGGSWYYDAEFARATYRYHQDARYYYSFTGFRCVRSE
jgi:serine/threonine-protein kinase